MSNSMPPASTSTCPAISPATIAAFNNSHASVPTNKVLHINLDDNPNAMVYMKMEGIIEKMQKEDGGVPIRTVKSFMTKIPSVFTGQDLIQWLMNNMELDDTNEALILGRVDY